VVIFHSDGYGLVVRDRDVEAHCEYRKKRLILEAMTSGGGDRQLRNESSRPSQLTGAHEQRSEAMTDRRTK
jgi:hypothetical protein